MKRIIILFTACLVLTILSSCKSSENEEIKIPRVEIVAKKHVTVDQEIKIEAKVYYGEDFVTDAEVTFEIKQGDEKQMLEGKQEEKGVYSIHYTFKEEGIYTVTAHTNAKNYHTMPNTDIIVER